MMEQFWRFIGVTSDSCGWAENRKAEKPKSRIQKRTNNPKCGKVVVYGKVRVTVLLLAYRPTHEYLLDFSVFQSLR